MRNLITALIIAIAIVPLKAQVISITKKTGSHNYRDDMQFAESSDSAFKIMSFLLSSPEFRTAISALRFPHSSYCRGYGNRGSIDGTDILTVLYRRQADSLKLVIEDSSDALGNTFAGSDSTTAFYKPIYNDMCHLPFSVALAVNLCHEYMHRLGYCHQHKPHEHTYRTPPTGDKCTDEKYDPDAYSRDVAYRVGWIAYDILNTLYKEQKLFPAAMGK